MASFKSSQEFLEALDKAGKLCTISTAVNKDTQLYSLINLQQRGLPRDQHKAFLFTNVVDSRGRKYDMPVAVGESSYAAIALKCKQDEVVEKLCHAMDHPIPTKLVSKGPSQEVVYMGDHLLDKGGTDEIPVPNRHPGWDGGPINGASCWVTKDMDTGVQNIGVYRSEVYLKDKVGIHMAGPARHIQIHWQKARARGKPLQCAIVLGGPPHLTWAGTLRAPRGVDEYTIIGSLIGEPIELVKCKTVDLEVPALADIVIEGEMTTEWMVLEGPHGEAGEIESTEILQPYMNVTAITHRNKPVFSSQAGGPPGTTYWRLKYHMNMPWVLGVSSAETTAPSSASIVGIKIKDNTPQEDVWRTLEVFSQRFDSESERSTGKYIIAVDEDIDVRDTDMLLWALGTRVEPHRDFRTVNYLGTDLKPSSFGPEEEIAKIRNNQFDPYVQLPIASRVLINATRKFPYSPVCLPKKQFMEEALALWKELNLPKLELREPWYGYEMGYWPKEYEEDAQRAVKGQWEKTSETRFKNRVKINYPLGGF